MALALSDDGSAFVAVDGFGVVAVDLAAALLMDPADPGAPNVGTLSSLPNNPADGFGGDGRDIALAEEIGVLVGADGLLVFDPTALVELGRIANVDSADPTSAAPNPVLTAASSRPQSIPQAVSLLSDFPFDVDADGELEVPAELRDLAVVAGGDNGTVQLFDVTQRDTPSLLSVIRLPGSTLGATFDIEERVVYVAGADGVHVVDIDAPSSLQPIDIDRDGHDDRILGWIPTAGTARNTSIRLRRGLIYVADGDAGVSVAQVTPPRGLIADVRRDPLLAVEGDDESILSSNTMFLTDEALQIDLDSTTPPGNFVYVALVAEPLADGSDPITFDDGSTVRFLAGGETSLTAQLAVNDLMTTRHLSIELREFNGLVLERVDVDVAPVDVSGLVLQELSIAPAEITIDAETTASQLSVAGLYSDGRFRNLTRGVTGTAYASLNPNVISVDANGLLSVVAGGGAEVLVTQGANFVTATVDAQHLPVIASLELTPRYATLVDLGQTLQLSAIGRMTNGILQNVASGFGLVYSSSNTAVLTVSDSGVVTAVGEGLATISVSDVTRGLGGQMQLAVEPRVLPSVSGITLSTMPNAARVGKTPPLASAQISGSGDLGGLPVQMTVNSPLGTTDYTARTGRDGIATASLVGLNFVGTVSVSATITDPVGGASLTDAVTLEVLPRIGDVEPNDRPSNAIPLAIEEPLSGTIDASSDPVDVVGFGNGIRGELRVRLQLGGSLIPADVAIVVRDLLGSEVARLNPVSLNDEILVPAAPEGGTISIETNNGSGTYQLEFLFDQGELAITDVMPTIATLGDEIIIRGRGFSTRAQDNLVLLGFAAAPVVSATETELRVLVPANAIDGAVEVYVADRVASGPAVNVGNAGPLPPITLTPIDRTAIRRDPVSGSLVAVDRLRVDISPLASRSQVDVLAAAFNGSVIGHIPTFNKYVLGFPAIRTVTALNVVRSQLVAHPLVRQVSLERLRATPATVRAVDHQSDMRVVDELHPDSLQAYRRIRMLEAIDAVRNHPDFRDSSHLRPVRVAMIDTGFSPIASGEFIGGYIEQIDATANQSNFRGLLPSEPFAAADSHGTNVLGIFGALNDRTGMSGVWTSLFDAGEDISDRVNILSIARLNWVRQLIWTFCRTVP